MSAGQPASLDGSLLARKGAAAPAITDESPFVLHLDEHRPQSDAAAAGPKGAAHADPAGLAAAAGKGWRRVIAKLASFSPRVRLMLAGVAAVAVVAILWPSDRSSGTSQVDTGQTDAGNASGAVAVTETDSTNLKLNLTAATEAPEKQSNSSAPLVTAIAMPASVARVAAVMPVRVDTAAPVVSVAAKILAAPLNVESVILANVTSRDAAPSVGSVDPSPEILVTLPKLVSPIPIPRAKPDVAALPAGRHAVQLASISIEKRANAEAFRLQKRLGGVLSGREIRVEKAVVKGKGTMYRLRASGYRSYAEAHAACTKVARLKVNCLAIRR